MNTAQRIAQIIERAKENTAARQPLLQGHKVYKISKHNFAVDFHYSQPNAPEETSKTTFDGQYWS